MSGAVIVVRTSFLPIWIRWSTVTLIGSESGASLPDAGRQSRSRCSSRRNSGWSFRVACVHLQRRCVRHSPYVWSKALTHLKLVGYLKSPAPISGRCSPEPASGSAGALKANGSSKRKSDMFSCRQTIRRTLDLLERRLSPRERLGRWGHLAICRHCRAHSRQINGLAFVFKRQDNLAEISLPRLAPGVRARIATAIVDASRE